MSSSHVCVESYPVYVVALLSGSASPMLAILCRLTQLPCPEHLFGQSILWQASPLNPAKQLQSPEARSHSPWFAHSARGWAEEDEVGTEPQARAEGHTRKEQSGAFRMEMSVSAPQPS